ncbi:MAG: hypothetical protein M3N16_00605 [Actinomycetota bacterium]|nr:hypothetical protein [Actinomycetota bacterium]
MSGLREEILQAQRTRSDLLKWKLVLVGGIGAAGLGLAGSDVPGHADLVLAAIPLVCLYVDLLCRHLSLRILVIGTFLRDPPDQELGEAALIRKYEEYAEDARNLRLDRHRALRRAFGVGRTANAFALEDWALSGSTITLSLAILAYGVFAAIDADADLTLATPFLSSGVFGALVTLAAKVSFTTRADAVKKLTPGRTDARGEEPVS